MAASGEREMDMSHRGVEEDRQDMRMSFPGSAGVVQNRRASGPAAASAGTRNRMDILARTVEADVIPRLVMARRNAVRPRQTGPASNLCNAEDVAELSRLVLDADEAAAPAFVEGLHERGLSMEAIYIELFADTARRLGAQWDDDDITFTHVTTGVWRLQQMLHHFRSAFLAEAPRRDTGLRILLAPAIGSQHSLGTAMVGEFFRRDGWSVHTALVTSNTDLADIVRAEWFDAIGFSLGDTGRLADLRTTIEAGRRASRNLQIGIIVGGPAFAQDASYGGFVGADAVAMDGRDAPRLIEEALNLSARPG